MLVYSWEHDLFLWAIYTMAMLNNQMLYPLVTKHTQMIHGAGIFTYIYPINDPTVGKYAIHGSSGIAIENGPVEIVAIEIDRNSEFSHSTWWFSIVMWVFQKANNVKSCKILEISCKHRWSLPQNCSWLSDSSPPPKGWRSRRHRSEAGGPHPQRWLNPQPWQS